MRKVSLTLLLLVLSFALPSWAEEVSGSQAKRYMLDNGMVVILKERPSVGVVNLQAWVKAGSITEGKYMGSGISHFVEHMLFKGTEKRGVGQIAKEVADCGGVIHGYTSHDRTVFSITIPSLHFDKGLDILSDALMNSSFDQEEFNKERQVVLREIEMGEDSPERVLNRLFFKTAFREHPYHHPVIGYRDQFITLTRKDLIDYYKRMYVPNNIILVVVGEIKIDEALTKIKGTFLDFKRKALDPIFIPKEPEQLGERRAIKPFDIRLAHLRLGFRIPPIGCEDVYPLDVLAVILGEGRLSRLYRRIKEEKGLVYTIGAYSYTPRYEGIFGIDATLDQENLGKAEKAIIDELEYLKKEYVNDEELMRAKRIIFAKEVFSRETIEGEAYSLALNELTTGNLDFSKIYIERILKVTKEELKRVANKYFNRSNLTTVAIVPKGGIKEETPPQPPASPLQEITKVTLDNGLVLLLYENPTIPTVSLRAVFKGGVRVENEKNNGITNFTRRMLLKGTSSRSEEEISGAIEGLGGSIETYVGRNSFGVTISLLKDDLDVGLDILRDILMNSNFPLVAIEKERRFILGQIKSLEDDPFKATERLLKETLFNLHPYRWPKIGSKESVESITREDLLRFYTNYVRPNNMVLAIFGDIKKEEVIPKVKEYFKGFEMKPIPQVFTPEEPPLKEIRRAIIFRDKQQSIIMIGFHGIDVKSPHRYAFEVMTSILSGQDGRLFKALREENPLSYAVGSYSILGLDRGAYIFYIATSPELEDEAIKGLLKEIKRIRDEGVSQEELLRAKSQLIGKKKIDLQSNSSYSLYVSLDELYGLGYKSLKEYEENINNVTKEEIQKIANTYFDLNAYTLAILRPEEKR